MSPPPRPPLPIDPHLPRLVAAARAGLLVLQAEPGAGKTTRLPPALADALAGEGEVWVLEPRRLAVRLAGRHVARELGEEPGGRVGWRVRHEDVGGPGTRLRYVTEGVLTRRLVSDPGLRGIAAVVLDEFHERHLDADLALALLLRLRATDRPDLRLVIMSATLEAARLGDFLAAPVVEVEGRAHPVSIEHEVRPETDPLERRVAATIAALYASSAAAATGDTLVFLPGAAEIRRCLAACEPLARERGLVLAPLHGALPLAEQDRALRPADRPKVILSTNVAESSVTVEGVTCVIDSGLERVAVDDPWSGIRRLEVRPISRASATQRAARAGRVRPGRALRLYTQRDHDGRPERASPEILRLDLAGPVLALAAVGVADPGALRWVDPPPSAALAAARSLLRALGALDEAGAPTEVGRRMSRLPLPPRLARVVVEGVDRGAAELAVAAAALLGERDIRREARAGALRGRGGGGGPARPPETEGESDLLHLIDLFEDARAHRFAPARLRARGLDPDACRAVDRARAQLLRIAGGRGRGASSAAAGAADDPELALRRALLAGFADRVARRREPRGEALTMSDGSALRQDEQSVVRAADWLVVLDAHERRGGRHGGIVARLVAAIEPDWLIELPDGVREEVDVRWDAKRERAVATERLRHGALVLDERPAAGPPGEEVARVLRKEALAAGPGAFCDRDALSLFIHRLAFARTIDPSLPELGEADAVAALEALCEGRRSFEELRAAGLLATLEARLDHAQSARLRALAPESVTLPGGRRLRVVYEPGKPPWAASRLQDFFGSRDGPRIAGGAEPLVLHLLAPNQRPVQITTDLAGFWERHYPSVRRELARKYPKHPWPEDPLAASPPPPGGRRGGGRRRR